MLRSLPRRKERIGLGKSSQGCLCAVCVTCCDIRCYIVPLIRSSLVSPQTLGRRLARPSFSIVWSLCVCVLFCFVFRPPFHLPSRPIYLLIQRAPFRISDPGSHGRHFSFPPPPAATVHAFIFFAGRFWRFLPSSTRVCLCISSYITKH